MAYDYISAQSYGQLRFGMSPDEVKAVLGEPIAFRWPFEGIPIPSDIEAEVADLRVMDFAGSRASNDFPQASFDKNRLVALTLFDRNDPVLVGDIDLFATDRKAVLRSLAALEETYYENGEDFFFPRSGVSLPAARWAKKLPYITLVDSAYEMTRLDYKLFDPSTSLG